MGRKKTAEYTRINTLCSKELYLQAKMKDLNLREALEAGITVLLGIQEREEDQIVEQISHYSGEITVLQQQLAKIREKRKKEQENVVEIKLGEGGFYG